MTKKKLTKEDNPNRIQIPQTRAAGKVKPTSLFDNIQLRHPLEDIFAQKPDNEPSIISPDEFGNPSENILDSQISSALDSQALEVGNPKEITLASQIIELGQPNAKELDSQSREIGQPNSESLDSILPKTENWTAKKDDSLDSIQPKENKLASQKKEKTKFLKKYDKARSTEPVNLRPDKLVVKRVRHFIVENKMTLKDFFEHSATKYMDEFGQPNNKSLDSILPYDDRRLMTLYKTKPLIINLYLTYNSVFNPKSKWSVRDDEAGFSLNDVDLRIIELGIMQTQANKNFTGKINSFGYYLPEIENFLALNMPEDALEVMLSINRRNWNNRTGKSVNLDFLNET